jgi:RNA polymerase sigma-32 factor
MIDFINLPSEHSPEFLIEYGENLKRAEILSDSLELLSDRDKDIIISRHSDNKCSFRELSERYNLSSERIRQIERDSLKFIKKWINKNHPNLEYI